MSAGWDVLLNPAFWLGWLIASIVTAAALLPLLRASR